VPFQSSEQETKVLRIIKFNELTAVFFISFVTFICHNSVFATGEIPVYVPGQMVCYVSDPSIIDSINFEYGCEYLTYSATLHDYLLQTDPERDIDSLAAIIAAYPGVDYCYPNYVLYAPEPVQASQPFIDAIGEDIFPQQAAAQILNLDSTHDYTTGSSAVVGILDGGIDFYHSLFSTNVSSGNDYVDNDNLSQDEAGGSASGHGTFVAGIVRLTAPDAHIISYRILDTNGLGSGFYIAEAIVNAVDDNCNVINLSFVMAGVHPTIVKALEYARLNDVVVVAAAGNDSSMIDRFPASDINCICVAAVDSFGFKADFSNFGQTVKLVAPGTGIYATFPGNFYARWDGTSFAAPFVTGQAALLFALNPEADWNDINNSVCSLAVNVDSINPPYTGLLGFGLIDPLATVQQFGGYVCGDFNHDGSLPSILDLTYIVDYVFRGGPIPANLLAANCDGIAGTPNILDLTCMVDFIFRSGHEPVCSP
jgi:subtilisin family serine protease